MSSYTKRSSTRRSDDTMDDEGEDKDDTKRKSRNLSEKKRRDQFNMLVNELSSMVSTGARKMDKSTVLRSTITFLKNHNEIAIRSRAHEIQEDWKPAFLSNEEFTHLILEALDGFIVVFSAAGQIHYVSESVTPLLGHLPNELLHSSVYELIWDEEQTALYQALVGGGTSTQLSFQAHLRRGGLDPDQDFFELVHFVGYLRTDMEQVDSSPGTTAEADTRLFVGTGRLRTPQLIREMSLLDAAAVVPASSTHSGRSPAGEFTSRHSLEWKFLFLDHRAPPIIGYLPFEVLGTSGYDYYHVDDLDKVVSCHEALMQKGEGTSCYYRFLTKGQQWIWLQTRFYITYHQWNSKPEFIVCTHRVVSYVDVMKQNRKSNVQSNEPTAIVDSSPIPTSTPGSGASSPWGSSHLSNRHRRRVPGPPSDCTSMSADSPASRQSQAQAISSQKQQSGRSSQLSSHSHNAGPGLAPGPSATVLYGEMSAQPPQPQYITANPVQSTVIAGFTAPTAVVISQLPQAVDPGAIVLTDTPPDPGGGCTAPNPNSTHLQAQLQRKHAELQAIIGQQQAELRRVSEQLLMARLGLLAPQQQAATPPMPSQHSLQQQNTLINVSVPFVCNSNVSSTTTSPCLAAPQPLCPHSDEITPQPSLVFTASSSTGPPHQN